MSEQSTEGAAPTVLAAGAADRPAAAKKRLHRRLYDWVLHWADTPFGVPALFLLSFAESSFFPIPPDVLLIALVLGKPSRAFYFAAVCTIASAAGGVAGYGIGWALMDTVGQRIIDFYHAQDYWVRVTAWYAAYDFWIVFVAAFTPIPYKVFTIASGAFHMNLLGFAAVSLVGRGMRFFIVAALLYYFGPPMKRMIDKYFDLLCVLFVVLLIGGFGVVKWLK